MSIGRRPGPRGAFRGSPGRSARRSSPGSASRRPPLHEDPGLQPERTVLAWGRTLLLFTTVAAVFLRWLPRYGALMLVLALLAAAVAGAIYVTQRLRYRRQSRGISDESLEPDVAAVLVTSAATCALGVLGVVVVLG